MTEAEDHQMVDSSHLVANCVLNAFLSCTAITLNIITIHALRKTSSLPKPLKTLLLSLAISDLGVGLLIQPLSVSVRSLVVLKKNAEKIKNVVSVTSTFLCYASLFGVTALTADRFLGIHLHLRYQELVTHRRVVAVVTSFWVLSAIFSLFWLWNEKILFIVIGIIISACLILTALFHCKICLAVRRHANQIHVQQAQQIAQNNEVMINTTRRQIKSAVTTFYVYLVFLICYLPHMTINVVLAITGNHTHTNTIWEYTLTLVYLNSSLNPLVYFWKMRPIRHAIINILRNMFSR